MRAPDLCALLGLWVFSEPYHQRLVTGLEEVSQLEQRWLLLSALYHPIDASLVLLMETTSRTVSALLFGWLISDSNYAFSLKSIHFKTLSHRYNSLQKHS